MTLDDQLRAGLKGSYETWAPEAPDLLPEPHTSRVPLVVGAGITVVALAGVGITAAVAASGHPGAVKTAGAAAASSGIEPCTPDTARLVVRTNQSSYVQRSPGDPDSTLVHVSAELLPTTSTPCRSFTWSQEIAFISPAGVATPATAGCLNGALTRHNETGALPSPDSAADIGLCHPATVTARSNPSSTPSESETDPGSHEDYGLILESAAPTAARESVATLQMRGQLTGPEPHFGLLEVGGVDGGNMLAPGTWTVRVIDGPWTASTTFTVTPR